MRKFVENLHILLLVNSETLLRVAEGKPDRGLGTRSQFNCTKTTGGRMQINQCSGATQTAWHMWCWQRLGNQSRGEGVEVAQDRNEIYLFYRFLYWITQGTVISELSIPQCRTSACGQWNTSQSREAYSSVFWSITAASLNFLSVDRSNAPGYTESLPTGRQQTN